MLSFSHSGTSGDLLSSLPAIRHLGGGKLFLRLRNTTWPNRMNEQDFDFLRPLLLATDYIKDFGIYEKNQICDHDLDRFRLYLERTHFISLIGLHFLAVGQMDFPENDVLQKEAYLKPFLSVTQTRKIPGKYIGVSRTPRHREKSPDSHYFWQRMVNDGLGEVGLFFGLPNEHRDFESLYNTKIEYVPTSNALELAEYISGVECFVSNPTMSYWIATGLQKTTMLETRQVWRGQLHKWSRNECNNHRPHGMVMPFLPYMT